jgi:hypothetical protein
MFPDSHFNEGEVDNKQTRIESLGRLVNIKNEAQFLNLLRGMSWSGVVDVTDWTLASLTALVTICSEENLTITLKQGNRYFMPIHFPRGPLLKSFAKMIMAGQF